MITLARATYALVKEKAGGKDIVGWDQTAIEAIIDDADNHIDDYTHPVVLSETDPLVINIACDVVLRLVRKGDLAQQISGTSSHDGRTYPDIEPLTQSMKASLDSLKQSSSNYGWRIARQIPE